jgi:hypothetical protein
MIDLPENELFSAYLDGELTAEEQAQVEQLLATSAAARQLMDELRTLSSTLQSLPVHKPGVDLSQRVLRAAERQILSGGDLRPAEAGPPPEPVPSPASIVGRDLWKRFLRPRSLLWAAAIFLVALFLRLQEPGPPNPPAARPHDGQQIAMAPPLDRVEEPPSIHAPEKRAPGRESLKRAEMAAPPARETGATVGLPNRDFRTAGQASSGTQAPPANGPAPPAKPPMGAVAGLAKEGPPNSAFGSTPPAAPSGPLAGAAAPSEIPAPSAFRAKGGKPGATVGVPDPAFRTAEQAGNGTQAAETAPAEMPALSGLGTGGLKPGSRQEKAPADAVALRDKGGERALEEVVVQNAPPGATVGSPNRALHTAGPAGSDTDAEFAPIAGRPPTAAPRPAKASSRTRKGQVAEKVLLVECEVTFQAAREHAFEKMLADQQLSGRLADYHRRGVMAGRGAAEDKLAAGKSADGRDRGSRPEAAKKGADKDARVDAHAQTGPVGEPAQVAGTRSFEVEATPQQLGAILERLKAQREDFPSVTLSPEVNQLRFQGGQAANDGVKQKQADEGRYAADSAGGMGGSFQYQGVTAKAGPIPASPPSVAEEKAAVENRLVEGSQRQNREETRRSLASQKGRAAEQEKTPQATPPMAAKLTLMPSTASASAPGQPPGSALGGQLGGQPSPRYRVRFVLRVVSPEPSAAGNALTDRASQSAKPAESKPADPAAGPVPVAAPAAPAAAPSK